MFTRIIILLASSRAMSWSPTKLTLADLSDDTRRAAA